MAIGNNKRYNPLKNLKSHKPLCSKPTSIHTTPKYEDFIKTIMVGDFNVSFIKFNTSSKLKISTATEK